MYSVTTVFNFFIDFEKTPRFKKKQKKYYINDSFNIKKKKSDFKD